MDNKIIYLYLTGEILLKSEFKTYGIPGSRIPPPPRPPEGQKKVLATPVSPPMSHSVSLPVCQTISPFLA